MGYYTLVRGEIDIDPPITWAELQPHPEFMNDEGVRCVVIRLVQEAEETDDGTLLRRTGVAIVPCSEDRFKAYTIVEDVQRIVDAFPGATFTGRFDCEGEEAGDIWRLEVRDRKAERITPRIEWPGGEVQVGRR